MRSLLTCVLCVTASIAVFPAIANADQIVQTGTISGAGDPMVQPLVLDQFDDMAGTLRLRWVRMDLLTSVIGGYTGDGSGIPVHIFAQLDAEYSLNGTLLADTQALIDTIVPNTSQNSATVFNTDTADVFINDDIELIPWIGTGDITLDVFTQFQVSEDPADIIFFSAGGTVRYTVTYNYSVPAPGAAALLACGAMFGGRRRTRRV